MKLELSYIQYSNKTTAEGVATEREREYTYFETYLSPQTHPNHRSHRTGCWYLIRVKRQELGRTHPLFHPNIHQYKCTRNLDQSHSLCKSQQQPSKQHDPPGQTPPPPRPPSTTSLQIKTTPSKCTNDDHLFGSGHVLSLFWRMSFCRRDLPMHCWSFGPWC